MKLGAKVDVEFRVGELLRCPLRTFPISEAAIDDGFFDMAHGDARVGTVDAEVVLAEENDFW